MFKYSTQAVTFVTFSYPISYGTELRADVSPYANVKAVTFKGGGGEQRCLELPAITALTRNPCSRAAISRETVKSLTLSP